MEHEHSDAVMVHRLRQAVVFGGAAALVALYAMRGGSYDIVPRQELGIAAWLIVGFGYALGLLPRARVSRASLLPLAALAGLAVWTAIALSWTESQERTTAELARVIDYGGLMVLALSVLDRRDWRPAAGGLAAAALAVSALAVASRVFPAGFPADAVKSVGGRRLSYPFNYWNAVSAWAVMAIAMGLAWSAHAQRLATRSMALAAVPPAALAAYLTYSRAAIGGVAIGVTLVLALSRNRQVALLHAIAAAAASALAIAAARHEPQIALGKGSAGAAQVALLLVLAAGLCVAVTTATWVLRADRFRMPRRAARRGLAVVAAAALMIGTFTGPTLAQSAWDSFKTAPPAVDNDLAGRLTNLNGTRYYLWSSALGAFAAHPSRGTGPGTYEFWWSRDAREPEFVRDAHSLYLQSLAEEGWPGLLLVLLFVAAALASSLASMGRGRRLTVDERGAAVALVAAFAVFVFHAGVDWMWESTAVSALALLSVAVAASANGIPLARVPRGWRAAVAALAVIAVLVQLPALVSASETRRSQASARAGDINAALSHANDAIAAEPWASTPYLQRGLVLESTDQLLPAKRDVRRAIAREPTNWRPELVLSRIEAELGRPRQALEAYRRARKLRPFSPLLAGGRR